MTRFESTHFECPACGSWRMVQLARERNGLPETREQLECCACYRRFRTEGGKLIAVFSLKPYVEPTRRRLAQWLETRRLEGDYRELVRLMQKRGFLEPHDGDPMEAARRTGRTDRDWLADVRQN